MVQDGGRSPHGAETVLQVPAIHHATQKRHLFSQPQGPQMRNRGQLIPADLLGTGGIKTFSLVGGRAF